ncbi:MAG: MFS transporter [Faecousia sp.]
MKLNYKRTIYVGFAFFLICAFWQAYDTIIPKILTDKFGMSQTASGVVMALDNILGLFILPLFGSLSDRTRTRFGRRTPYIVIGTLVAVCSLVCLSFVDNLQIANLDRVAVIDDPQALHQIYESQSSYKLKNAQGDSFVLEEVFTEEAFCQIRSQVEVDGKLTTNPDYTNYVVPARQAYAWQVTADSPAVLVFFIGLLLVVLLSMAIFRSPAVALMPDVTIKPLRSKGNAVINLMGTAGGMLVLVLGKVFATSALRNSMMSYTAFFTVVAGVMVGALAIFLWKVREPQFVREMREESARYGIDESDGDDQGEKRKLGAAEKRSLLFILASVALWYMGYNAVTSKYSVYADKVLNLDYNMTLLIAQGAAIASYLPVGMLASRIGRKKSILLGVAMLTAAFFCASFIRLGSSSLVINCLFALAGIGWATINVNSFPMVAEMSRGGDIGKYTGFYYTASMAAQTVTPLLSGYLMDKTSMVSLFPYATIFAALAFVTMLFVQHGDSRPVPKKGLEALDVDD